MTKDGKKVNLFIVDPQNDFMGHKNGKPYRVGNNVADLPVPGSVEDMDRLVAMIESNSDEIDEVFVCIDTHDVIHIGHASMWMDANGKSPAKFTSISEANIQVGYYTTRNPAHLPVVLKYANELEKTGKFRIMIWSELGHCLVGTWGHNIYAPLSDALHSWSVKKVRPVRYIFKGMNPWTENYGAFAAEVPDPTDPTTMLNMDLINEICDADIVATTGEASSHCLMESVTQIADNVDPRLLSRFQLISNCMSPVPAVPGLDFPAIADDFLRNMESRGMKIVSSFDFLK